MINVIVVMCIRKEVNNFLTMRICYIKASHSLLEPYEGKLSCTVLRGESPREGADLLDHGEYLAWHSKNIRLVRCHISGEQPLCYSDGIVLEDCTFDAACDRAFEDCTNVEARIKGTITEVKNPISGRIQADNIGRLTMDQFAKGHVASTSDDGNSLTFESNR